MAMKIGIPKEVHAGERRVAATPETAEQIQKLGFGIALESCAGSASAAAEGGEVVATTVEETQAA